MNVYGLIGNPLGHSFSKKYFTEKFEKEGRNDCRFELYPLSTISEFPSLIENTKDLRGLAVTIPYKEAVIPFLDDISEEAKKIGAVNCIKIIANRLRGYNTDAIGFERSLKPLLQPHHAKALVLGSGGSSKAVQYVLDKLRITFLVVTRNEMERAGFINYSAIDENITNDHPLIINCTPVGMYPNEAEQPLLPYHFLHKKNLLFDLIYRPAETRFLASGKQFGATVKNGFEMLMIQAEENWRIWNAEE
ncbi:MAG: shikimate dehydrogenase [Ferruginibacter sp.]